MPRPLALVTGPTAGIGRIYAERLAVDHDLLLVARDARRLRELADEIGPRSGARVECFPADLSTEAGIAAVAGRIGELDRLGILVNNAGFGTKGKFHTRPPGEQAGMVRLHALAPMLLARAAIPGMVERRQGAVVNVASVAAWTWAPGSVNYCATKAYLVSFGESLALELAGSGVRVQTVCPGFTRTEFHGRMSLDTSHIARWLWLSPEQVVDEALASLRAGGPTTFIPARRWRVIVALLRTLPDAFRRRMTERNYDRGR